MQCSRKEFEHACMRVTTDEDQDMSSMHPQFVVKRAGLGFAEFGLVDARAAKRQRTEAAPAEGSTHAPLPLTLVDEYERFAAKFHAAVHDHTEDGELDLGAVLMLCLPLVSCSPGGAHNCLLHF